MVSITRHLIAAVKWANNVESLAVGVDNPRFAIGQPRDDRPIVSILYLIVRSLVRLLASDGQRGPDDGSKDLEILAQDPA